MIGGGLLGLEAAYGVAAQGCPVTVVHLMDRLMERQLDDSAAALLRPAMEELGVEVLLERQTERILGAERVEGLRFAGGEELEADLVVIGIGIRPQASLAARCRASRSNRGIVVDDEMRTSAPVGLGGGRVRRAPRHGLRARRADPRAGRGSGRIAARRLRAPPTRARCSGRS